MIPAWLMFALVFGVNFTLWGTIGLLRIVDGALDRFRRLPRNAGSAAHRARRAAMLIQAAANGGLAGSTLASGGGRILTIADVAVLMAAHNEEVVIDDSLAAITALVPRENVHVVSDASTDSTVDLALRHGVNVIETATNVGKAGALEEGIRTFGLVERFSAVLLLDADTRLDPGYFEAALPAAVRGGTCQGPGLADRPPAVTSFDHGGDNTGRIIALTRAVAGDVHLTSTYGTARRCAAG